MRQREMTCQIEGCSKPCRCKNMCLGHWRQWWKYGDPLLKKHAAGGSGHDHNGYRRRTHNGRRMMEHVIAWEETYGPVPTGFSIHHINENKSDNRLENLMCMKIGAHMSLHMKDRLRKARESDDPDRKLLWCEKGSKKSERCIARMRIAQQARGAAISASLKEQWRLGIRRRYVGPKRTYRRKAVV